MLQAIFCSLLACSWICSFARSVCSQKHRELKWPKIDSKVTRDLICESCLSQFWVTLGWDVRSHCRVTFGYPVRGQQRAPENTTHPKTATSQSRRFDTSVKCCDLKLQSTSEIATKIASRSAENECQSRSWNRSESKALRFQIASGLNLKLLAIWASKTQILGMVEFLHFLVCYIFGCVNVLWHTLREVSLRQCVVTCLWRKRWRRRGCPTARPRATDYWLGTDTCTDISAESKNLWIPSHMLLYLRPCEHELPVHFVGLCIDHRPGKLCRASKLFQIVFFWWWQHTSSSSSSSSSSLTQAPTTVKPPSLGRCTALFGKSLHPMQDVLGHAMNITMVLHWDLGTFCSHVYGIDAWSPWLSWLSAPPGSACNDSTPYPSSKVESEIPRARLLWDHFQQCDSEPWSRCLKVSSFW